MQVARKHNHLWTIMFWTLLWKKWLLYCKLQIESWTLTLPQHTSTHPPTSSSSSNRAQARIWFCVTNSGCSFAQLEIQTCHTTVMWWGKVFCYSWLFSMDKTEKLDYDCDRDNRPNMCGIKKTMGSLWVCYAHKQTFSQSCKTRNYNDKRCSHSFIHLRDPGAYPSCHKGWCASWGQTAFVAWLNGKNVETDWQPTFTAGEQITRR